MNLYTEKIITNIKRWEGLNSPTKNSAGASADGLRITYSSVTRSSCSGLQGALLSAANKCRLRIVWYRSGFAIYYGDLERYAIS
jgi:hypothetical protein